MTHCLIKEYTDENFLFVFYLLASKIFTLSLDKWNVKNNTVKYLQRMFFVVHFPLALELSASLIQEI